MAFDQFMPGATAVGVTFDKGVVLAAEKRIALGTYIVSKGTKKTFRITDHVGAACAGMVADMQILIRQVESLAKIKALETRRPMPPNSIAKLISVMLFERRYFPLLTQVIIGGVDDKPAIYTLDPLGSLLSDDFAVAGTGSEMAIGVIEASFKPNMSEKEAKELAVKAIRSAVSRDAASGDGVDMLVITQNGSKEESIKF
ncbi:MAG: proteasome subunit beta [Nitrososphaerales archaeon]